jgi:hypothetical protein
METAERAQILHALEKVMREVEQARSLVEAGESIAALRALTRVRGLNRQVIAGMVTNCAQKLVDEAKDSRQEHLEELTRLLRFAWSGLCPACRSEVGKRWKEPEDV